MDQCYMEINLLFLNLWYLVVDNLINTVNGKLKILKRTKTKTLLRQKDDKIQQLRISNVYLTLIHACLFLEISAGVANTLTIKLNAVAQINSVCCRYVPVIDVSVI